MEREVVKGKEMEKKLTSCEHCESMKVSTSASREYTGVEKSSKTHIVPPLTFPTPLEPFQLVDLFNSFTISTSL